MASPFVAKDGSRHTNRQTMMTADSRHSASQQGGKRGGGMSSAMSGNDGGYNEGAEEQADGAQMAAEHGPADEVTVQHDHEGGRHTVHARHPDGHEHDTEHESAGAAHKYAADCAGASDGGM